MFWHYFLFKQEEIESLNDDEQEQPMSEKVTLAGNQLVDYVKSLIAAGNVRRLIIRKPNDEVLLTAMAPVLAALGAMAALLTQVKVEIVRTDQSDDDSG